MKQKPADDDAARLLVGLACGVIEEAHVISAGGIRPKRIGTVEFESRISKLLIKLLRSRAASPPQIA